MALGEEDDGFRFATRRKERGEGARAASEGRAAPDGPRGTPGCPLNPSQDAWGGGFYASRTARNNAAEGGVERVPLDRVDVGYDFGATALARAPRRGADRDRMVDTPLRAALRRRRLRRPAIRRLTRLLRRSLPVLAGCSAFLALPLMDLGIDTGILQVVMLVVLMILCLSVHEAAHAWAALKCGDTTGRDEGRLTLNPIPHIDPIFTIVVPAMLLLLTNGAFAFGGAKPVPVNFYRLRHPGGT